MNGEMTSGQAIQVLGKALAQATAAQPLVQTGSCTFKVGQETHCIEGVTKPHCDTLNGTWVLNGTCKGSANT